MPNKEAPTPGATDQPFGFWVILKNEDDAHWALKMSGVVFFLMGGWLLLYGIALFVRSQPWQAALSTVLLGAFLLYAGLAMRRRRYGAFIPAACVFMIGYGVTVWSAPSLAFTVGTLQAILLISGFRALLFLKRRAGAS